MSLQGQVVDKPAGHFLNQRLIRKYPSHCGWGYAWNCGPGFSKKWQAGQTVVRKSIRSTPP